MKELWLKKYMPLGATAQVGRVAEVFGIIAASGEVAIASGVVPEKYGFTKWSAFKTVSAVFTRWLEELGDYTISAEAKIVKDKLLKFFFKHHANGFFNREQHIENCQVQHVCVGISLAMQPEKDAKQSIDNPREYYVFQDSLEREALKGYNIKDSRKIMKELGYIIPNEETKMGDKVIKRTTHAIRYARDKTVVRCYKLNLINLGITISELNKIDASKSVDLGATNSVRIVTPEENHSNLEAHFS